MNFETIFKKYQYLQIKYQRWILLLNVEETFKLLDIFLEHVFSENDIRRRTKKEP